MGFENLRFCKEEMESCVKTKTESLTEKEKHKREVLDLRNVILNLTKDLNIKTERERRLALRLEELRLVVMILLKSVSQWRGRNETDCLYFRLLNNRERYERNEAKD